MSNLGDVLNKARLFDDNLANHLVSITKVILILVDFAKKMEELLQNMRSLFDGLARKEIRRFYWRMCPTSLWRQLTFRALSDGDERLHQ